MSLVLPEDWEIFHEHVKHKVKTLCKTNVWDIDQNIVFAWLANFTEDEHKYLAAHILDRLIYRNENMAESSYTRFFSSFFIQYISDNSEAAYSSVSEWLKALSNGSCQSSHNVKLCSVSFPGDNGESGSQMVRLLTASLFKEKHVVSTDTIDITELKDHIILIVDDFVGSGDQFKEFADHVNLKAAAENNFIIFAPLVADEKGLKRLNDEDLGITIHPLEIITEQDRLFSFKEGAQFCGDESNTEEDALQCYQDMRNLSSGLGFGNWLGRNNASLSIAFEWGCPNQSLGIIWYNQSTSWNRLFRRRGYT